MTYASLEQLCMRAKAHGLVVFYVPDARTFRMVKP